MTMGSQIKTTLDQLSNHAGGTVMNVEGLVMRKSAPVVWLANDTKMSVQAGEYLYSTPRTDFAKFTHVEIGFPTFDPPETWMEYAEDQDEPQETIYAYIPIGLVLDYINMIGLRPIQGD